jgi:uncharacterized damage-inducible protein DinB
MYSLQEKNELLQRLDCARERLIAAVAGLSETQASFKPSPDAWSVAEIVEHIATVEVLVIMRLEKITSEPNHGNFKDSDVVLFDKVVDRTERFQAPKRVHPTGQSLGSSLERLVVTHERIVRLIRSASDAHFRQHSMDHPALGPLDGHQWVVTTAGHCLRHTQQILEVKSATHFPQR